jgi:hypothetical protein
MADITKSVQHKVYDLLNNDTRPIKDLIHAQVTTSNPADFTAVTNASALTAATATVTGVAVGDAVVAWGVVSGLAANQFVVAAYVSATDTVTFVIGNALNTSVTTTAVVLNVIVADLT